MLIPDAFLQVASKGLAICQPVKQNISDNKCREPHTDAYENPKATRTLYREHTENEDAGDADQESDRMGFQRITPRFIPSEDNTVTPTAN